VRPPNGLELREAVLWANCPAARAVRHPLYGNSAGQTSPKFPHATLVSRRSWCLSRVAYEVPVGLREHPRRRSPKGEAKRRGLRRVVSPLTLQLFKRSHRFHVIEILVHYLKADRFIESYRRYVRYTGRDAHAVHPARLHPAQTLE